MLAQGVNILSTSNSGGTAKETGTPHSLNCKVIDTPTSAGNSLAVAHVVCTMNVWCVIQT